MYNDIPFEEQGEVEKWRSRALVMLGNSDWDEPSSYLAVMPEGVVLRMVYERSPEVNDGWIEGEPQYLGILSEEALMYLKNYIDKTKLLELPNQEYVIDTERELYINYHDKSLGLNRARRSGDDEDDSDVIDELSRLITDLLVGADFLKAQE